MKVTLLMMHLISDILLIDSSDTGGDITKQWEDECDLRGLPKLKYPVKLMDDSMSDLNLNFIEPSIVEPKTKKKKDDSSIRVIDLGKKTKNEKNKKLF